LMFIWPVISHSFSSAMTLGHHIFMIYHKHLFTKDWSFLWIWHVTSQVWHPYSSTDFTYAANKYTNLLNSIIQNQSTAVTKIQWHYHSIHTDAYNLKTYLPICSFDRYDGYNIEKWLWHYTVNFSRNKRFSDVLWF
jgi:hypothetical protein